ncbi:hypothetical protein ABPG75_013977 [Micractinium tetrahymenae]
MEVTRHNFAEVLPLVKQALADCQFFALDCEMTGLFLEDKSGAYLDEIHDRYQEMLASSRAFVINQFGLSAFVWEDGAYRPRTFNFYLFPRPVEGLDKRFVCQSSSLDFLARCGFDFNKAIYDGINYLTAATRDQKLAAVDRPQRERSEVLVRRPEDVAFVQATVEAVKGWLQGEEATLELAPGNPFQRLLQYQELRRPQFGAADPPGFYVEKVENEDKLAVLRLTRASALEVAAWEAEQRRKRIDAIHEAAGFAAVFEAMRDCGKPAVGHNLAFDLAYSLHSYAEELPGSWEEYKALVGRWFPAGIFDTKHLSAQLPAVFEDTSLGYIHDGMLKGKLSEQLAEYLTNAAATAAENGSTGSEAAELPAVEHAPGFERYKDANTEAFAHEAGYDAYMTGAAFACLVRLFEAAEAGAAGAAAPGAAQQPQLDAVQQLCWRMNISRSDMPYAALQGEDPQPDRSHVFYLSGWEPSQRVYNNDVTKRLADAGLGQLRATSVEGGQGILLEVGDPEVVMGAADVLRERFPTWTVAPYSAYADKRRQARAEAAAAATAAREAAAARRNSNKRPRVEVEAAAAPTQAAAPGAAVLGGRDSWRCTIM